MFWSRRIALMALLVLPVSTSPEGAWSWLDGIVDLLVSGGNTFHWQKVEVPGAVCGNGSPYKFFVHRTGSPNLLFTFEGGGACWDYDGCSGRKGPLGASNIGGLPDDYMTRRVARYVAPLVNGVDPGILFVRPSAELVTKDWNVVYLPYCTGDVQSGSRVVTYQDPRGENPPLTWRFAGHQNAKLATSWTKSQFPAIQKLLVYGFSAGGTAANVNYFHIRNQLGARENYLLNDSGPIFPAPDASYPSRPLHDWIRPMWGLDTAFAEFPDTFDRNDFGSLMRMLALTFPGDRLAYTGYTRDYVFSRFSYEGFLTPNDKASVLLRWRLDEDRYVEELSRYPNVSFLIPYERPLGNSHCATVLTFQGSQGCQQMQKKHHWYELLEWPPGESYKCYGEMMPMGRFVERLVENGPLTRIVEPPNRYNLEDPAWLILSPFLQ